MRVLYVGDLNAGGTCFSRLRTLKTIADVHTFDACSYFESIGRWKRAIEFRILMGPRFIQANAELIKISKALRPEVVWVDKGFWVYPETLRQLRHHGAFLVHHNTDALYPGNWMVRWMYLFLRINMELYDLCFTTNIKDYHRLFQKKSAAIELTYLGYDHLRFNDAELPSNLRDKWSNELLFIGHYEPRTASGILALIEAGLPVTVYGAGWERVRQRDKLKGHVKFCTLDNEEYLNALKGAKVGLCFVSKLNGNQTAGRSFEIPASGTFLLAMRTEQHMECYVEGREAEFFGSHQELVKKARYYLEYDNKRKEISLLGHKRCVNSDYSWDRYMRDDWAKVLKAMGKKSKNSVCLDCCGSAAK